MNRKYIFCCALAIVAVIIWYIVKQFKEIKNTNSSSTNVVSTQASHENQPRRQDVKGLLAGNFDPPYTKVISLEDIRKGGDFLIQRESPNGTVGFYPNGQSGLGIKIYRDSTGAKGTFEMEYDGDRDKNMTWIENPSTSDLIVAGKPFKADIMIKKRYGPHDVIYGFRKEADGRVVWLNESVTLERSGVQKVDEQIWSVLRGSPSS